MRFNIEFIINVKESREEILMAEFTQPGQCRLSSVAMSKWNLHGLHQSYLWKIQVCRIRIFRDILYFKGHKFYAWWLQTPFFQIRIQLFPMTNLSSEPRGLILTVLWGEAQQTHGWHSLPTAPVCARLLQSVSSKFNCSFAFRIRRQSSYGADEGRLFNFSVAFRIRGLSSFGADEGRFCYFIKLILGGREITNSTSQNICVLVTGLHSGQ